MARGDAVICVSDTVRDYVRHHWPAAEPRLVVIPRGVDPAAFPRHARPDPSARAAVLAELALPDDTRLLLMPGRGTRLKGHADAIALLADLRAQGVPAALWLLGTDEPGREAYVGELRALAAARGVESALRLSPPRSEVVRAYAASDLVLQLSRKPEAFGRTVIEALSVGAPVLGWDHGGVGEQLAALQPEGAVPLGDPAALLRRARALLEAPPAAPAHIPYTLAAMQQATLETYARHAG
jgi:glycosyltransferase involved in cell wall biosynthesis